MEMHVGIKVNGVLVRQILLARGWTQADLAEVTKLSQGTLVNALNNKKATDLATLDRIARALGRNPLDLLVTEGHPAPQPEAPTASASASG